MAIDRSKMKSINASEADYPPEKLKWSYFKTPGYYHGGKSLADYLDETVAKYGSKPAMVSKYFDKIYEEERVWTWNELNGMVTSIALALIDLGIRKGDKVGICADSTPNFWIPQLACARIGATFFPIPPRHRKTEFHHVLSHSEAKAFFTTEKDAATGFSFIDMLDEMKSELPNLKHIIISRGDKQKGALSMYELMEKNWKKKYPGDYIHDTYLNEYPVTSEDLRDLQYTSGTTGDPKGIQCTYNARNYQTWGGNARIGLTSDDVYLCMAPATHATATTHTMDSAVLAGACLVLPGLFNAEYCLKLIEKFKVTFTAGVPALFIGMMNHPAFTRDGVSSLKKIWIGGAACPEVTAIEIKDKFGRGEAKLFAVYGMTETGGNIQTFADDSIEIFSTTVGKPFAGTEMSVQDPDGNLVPVGTTGEVCHRGGTLMTWYYKNPETTSKTIDKKGWLHSGDVGIITEDGNLKIVGRTGDKVNRGGEVIYVREVEEVLFKHPKVMEVNIVGYPDPVLDERTCAYVVLKDKSNTLTRDEVAEFMKDKIGKYKIPDRIEIIDALPVSAGGKVQKFKLKEIIKAKVEKERN